VTLSPKVVSEGQMETAYWLTPVGDITGLTASQVVHTLVIEEKIYAFREQIRAGKRIKGGDWICFYERGEGVVAHARVLTKPERQAHPKLQNIGHYPWVFKLELPQVYQTSPVVIDGSLRSKLDAFKGRALAQRWSWFVQSTREISQHDFEVLTRQRDK